MTRNHECATFVAIEPTRKVLMATLLRSGYGLAQLAGSAREPGGQDALLVVNLKGTPSFRDHLTKLSEYYRKDTFLYSPKGEAVPGLDELAERQLRLDTFDRYSVNGKWVISLLACETLSHIIIE